MQQHTYAIMDEVEGSHWWFVGRRAILEGFLRQILSRINGKREKINILDVGCGTRSLALLIKRAAPGAHVVGLDKDPQALSIARRKINAAGIRIEWRQGFAREAANGGAFDKGRVEPRVPSGSGR